MRFPNRLLSASLAVTLFFASVARAADTLSWSDVLAMAASTNPDLAAARERVRIAEAGRRAASAAFLPEISAGASYDRTGAESETSGGFEDSEAFGVSATARQNLFAGGRDAATVRRRNAELASALSELDRVRSVVSFDLKSAFARLLFSQRLVELTRSIDRRRAENVRLVGLRYEAGREHKGSFLRSRANARQAAFEVSQAGRALRVAQRELLRAAGRPEFQVVAATGTLVTAVPPEAPDFRALAQTVPDVRIAAAGVAAAESDVASARADFLPDLEASGSAGRSGADWPPERDRWTAGVSLSVPLFQGGRRLQDLKGAQASYRRSGEQSRSALDQAAVDLEDAHASYADAVERADVQSEFLEAATVRAEIARSQYTSGLLSFEDWDLIESDLITAQKNHLASLRDAVIAEAQWERSQGKGAVQ